MSRSLAPQCCLPISHAVSKSPGNLSAWGWGATGAEGPKADGTELFLGAEKGLYCVGLGKQEGPALKSIHKWFKAVLREICWLGNYRDNMGARGDLPAVLCERPWV